MIAQRMTLLFGLLLTLTATAATAAPADSPDGVWRDVPTASIATRGTVHTRPTAFRTVALDDAALVRALDAAPMEFSGAKGSVLFLPTPDGRYERFEIVEAPVMHPDLAKRYPDIRTYRGHGLDDPTAWVRLDRTPLGFHAMWKGAQGVAYIDPYQLVDGRAAGPEYLSYFKRDYPRSGDFRCEIHKLEDELAERAARQSAANRTPTGPQLRTYQLAVATTGEYTSFHGGTVAAGQAAVVTAINRVTGIYESEVAIRLVLIANNDQLIFTNAATDPYTNNNGLAMLGQNQSTIDSIIGSGGYDIGHVFSTGGGGIAGLGVVCAGGNKARGVTGLFSPIGDPFYVDYVAHEIGHQFDAQHTFNGTAGSCGGGNRSGSTAYEPGSGSTIMAYAGICGSHNIANNSDDHFHTASFDEIVSYTNFGFGSVCDTVTNTGNQAPGVEAGAGFTVPIGTPLRLTGSANDPDGDALVYRWEQFDLGPGGSPNSPSGNAPLFRSFSAVPDPVRLLPKLNDILTGSQTVGERLPTYARNLRFRLTALDQRAGGGGVDYDDVLHTVTDTSGPFAITTQNVATSWTPGTTETVNWDVANTDQAPVSCANVDILISYDLGQTFTDFLALFTANDGSHSFTVPDVQTNIARVLVQCSDNIFFDINNGNITILENPNPDFAIAVSPDPLEVCIPDDGIATVDVDSIGGFTGPVTLSASGEPAGGTVGFSPNPVNAGNASTMTLGTGGTAGGSYLVQVDGTGSTGTRSDSLTLNLTDGLASAPTPTAPADGAVNVDASPTLIWDPVADATGYLVEIATDSGFGNIVYSANEASTSHAVAATLSGSTQHFWRVSAQNFCGDNPSVTSSFTVVAGPILLCSTVNAPIPDGSGNVSDTINVSASGPVIDLNVYVEATHPYIGNLLVSLDKDGGTTAALIDRPGDPLFPGGCPLGDIAVTLDDEATVAAEDSCTTPAPALQGALLPNDPLSSFDGENGNGDWTLTVSDLAAGSSGSFVEWCVDIVLGDPVTDTDGDGVADDADNCTLVANPDQRDTNGDGYGNVCDTDLNNDGVTNPVDLGLLRAAFFSAGPGLDADFNGDNVVNPVDLGILRSFFFQAPGPSGVAP